MTLPPLPDAAELKVDGAALYSRSQVLAYAAAVRAATLEEAATEVERSAIFLKSYELAAAIRALKDKP